MGGEGECRALVIPLSPGPYSLDSLISSILRGVEEYGANVVYLVYTRRVAGEARRLAAKAREIIGCVEFVEREVCDWIEGGSGGCNTTQRLRRIIVEEAMKRCGERNVVVIISPASRRLAAAASLASLPQSQKDTTASTPTEAEVAHVDFYWGPWTGSTYPFVPRGLEPVIRLHPANAIAEEPRRLGKECGKSVAEPQSEKGGGVCTLPNGRRLPPIACGVARLARLLNLRGGRYYVDPGGGAISGCTAENGVALDVKVAVAKGLFNGRPVFKDCFRVSDLCSANAVRDAVKAAVKCVFNEIALPLESEKDPDKSKVWQLVMYTGIVPPVIERPESLKGGRLSDALPGGNVIIDTNMAYAGIHVEALRGLRVMVPSCAITEVAGRLSEKLKAPPSLWTFIDILAFAALEELRLLGAPIVETPGAVKCEAGIMALESRGAPLATRDWGALRLWELAARIKGGSNGGSLLFIKTPSYKEALSLAENLPLPDAYYALLQLVIVLKAASKYLQGKREHSLEIKVAGLVDEGKIPVPRTLKPPSP